MAVHKCHPAVSGSSAALSATDAVRVGDSNPGNNFLEILSGSHVVSHNGYLGYAAGSSGTATIDGSGSYWGYGGNGSVLTVGYNGTGTLNVLNGGLVGGDDGYLGYAAGSSGTATVDGSGSYWGLGNHLFVGINGTGTLSILNGGEVISAIGVVGNGTATVDGAGSLWGNYYSLGVTGTLNILNGGEVEQGSGFISGSDGRSGTVTVDGSGSTWSNYHLYIGGGASSSGGNGSLTVSNGGLVSVVDILKLWATGTVNLNGGTITAMSLVNQGTFNFNAGTLNIGGDLLTGTLSPALTLSGLKLLNVAGTTTLDGFSTLTLDGGTFSTGYLVDNGGFAFNRGTFNLTSDNLTIGTEGLFGSHVLLDYGKEVNVSNTINIDPGAVLSLRGGRLSGNLVNNSGVIDMADTLSKLGGGLLGNSGLIHGTGTVSAALTNHTGGEVRAATGDTLSFTGAGNANAGVINLTGGTVAFTQDVLNDAGGFINGRGTLVAQGDLTNHGSIDLSGGFTDIFGNVNNDNGGSITVSGNATATFYSDVVHNGTEIYVREGSSAVFFGAVSGAGPYNGQGAVWFEGDLNPGNSPGLVSVAGDMGLGVNSRTIMEIAGLERGSQYDAFDIGGTL